MPTTLHLASGNNDGHLSFRPSRRPVGFTE